MKVGSEPDFAEMIRAHRRELTAIQAAVATIAVLMGATAAASAVSVGAAAAGAAAVASGAGVAVWDRGMRCFIHQAVVVDLGNAIGEFMR